jgi:hypothetical protein
VEHGRGEIESAPIEYVHGDACLLMITEPDEGEADARGAEVDEEEVYSVLLRSELLSGFVARLERYVDMRRLSVPDGGWSYGEWIVFRSAPAATSRRILCKL